jgi:hypothetical protein
MPPSSQSPPDAAAKLMFLETLGDSLTRADLASREVVLRRLNKDEYENTVGDLLNIDVDLSRLLPDDRAEQGFDTIGSTLAISAEQMELYLQAADLVLDQVFGSSQEPKRFHKQIKFHDFRVRDRADRLTPEGGVVFGARTIPIWNSSVPSRGIIVFGFAPRRCRVQRQW